VVVLGGDFNCLADDKATGGRLKAAGMVCVASSKLMQIWVTAKPAKGSARIVSKRTITITSEPTITTRTPTMTCPSSSSSSFPDMDGRDAEALRLVVAHLYRERQLFVAALTSATAAFVVGSWWRRIYVPRRYYKAPMKRT
jgi:hypothetical protein